MVGPHDTILVEPMSPEALKAQKKRNLWLALGLVVFVILVGTMTAIRIGDANLSKDGGFYFTGSMEPVEDGQGAADQ